MVAETVALMVAETVVSLVDMTDHYWAYRLAGLTVFCLAAWTEKLMVVMKGDV